MEEGLNNKNIMRQDNKIIISTNQVTKTYGEGASLFNALHPTTLSISKGSINVILGKSGSGKTTLLSLLGGMEEPTNGHVWFKQQNFYKLKDPEQANIRGNNFGFIFQNYHLIPEISVFDNIILPLMINKKEKDISDIKKLTNILGIGHKLKSFPFQLSGGQQQRVAIARAMANDPEIIFADEPTGNLDQKNAEKVIELLVSLCKEFDKTLVIVTHEENLIERPDQLFLIEDGRVKTL
ncbi:MULTISPECIES: ABC transporter ATP-binding protein [Bacillus]|uniref:ABC transporter ATP-binding protein n=1 Tax=Bacillus paralicheniformis TaxID=1648923 RepID=A0AAW6KGZ7_9BACI|nr:MULTISPECIES: ABC transporter ATP-binding protein [Bacillus]MBC8624197.1 ABC transporter ATP-binding protein [Robertmurraya crescens]MBX9436266.1 ABC transporter ATP-binding protein [Bacillus paralicheniformis]MBZ5216774.1 ABC transporter ATP-binding protein [Bacillus paralicheniformis]MCA1183749.1 ABC transporter ATP-binding protein [Bacillus licheniformis]MCY1631287.1 ABC transporter ATP-binding protein [Bacillus paralicheniformis]